MFIDSSGSDSRLHGFENSSLSLHTVSTSEPNDDEIHHYDDIEDDEGVDKNAFQRHQSDNVSITNSLFTAVDHLEDDDNSSTENLRHGYLPQIDTILENNKSINAQVKKLNVKTSIVWQGTIYIKKKYTSSPLPHLDLFNHSIFYRL